MMCLDEGDAGGSGPSRNFALWASPPARFAVGQRLIAKADFGGEIRTKPVTVTAIQDGRILVEAADGTPGRFDLQGQYTCPVTGRMNTWLEANPDHG